MKQLSILTAHFFDFDWTALLIRRIRDTTPSDLLHEILVVDQDRTEPSRSRLLSLDPLVRVIQYPKSPRHFEWTRHDHSAVLNVAIRETAGDYVCLFDSDAHPISVEWVPRCRALLDECDAVLAEDPAAPGLSHPCFMVLKREDAHSGLLFDEGLFESSVDTGRLIGEQLRRAGRRVHLESGMAAFGGRWGQIILGSIYHHGHGSFAGVDDELLKSQVRWENGYFRQRVLTDGVYRLSCN